MISCYFDHSFVKHLKNETSKSSSFSMMYVSKNESESCQLVITSPEEAKDLFVEISDFKSASGETLSAEVLKEYYINCSGKMYPDPLYTLSAPFDIEANNSQSLLIKVKTSSETISGDYEATVSIKQYDETKKELSLKLHVWDFALPEETTCDTAMSIFGSQLMRFHPNADKIEIYKKYYDYLLENRVCGYELPFDILDVRADEYMSNPRVKSFRIPYSDDEEKLKAYYKKLSSNPAWLKKGYFYPVDEPSAIEHLEKIRKCGEKLKKHFPEYNMVVPFFINTQVDDETDGIASMSECVNIWCPKTFCYTTDAESESVPKAQSLYSKDQKEKYDSFKARMDKEKIGGDKVWWYVCWEPGLPYLNLFVDMTGLQNRLLFWQQKLLNVDGFLYWSTNYWHRVNDPWNDMATVQNWLTNEVFGDGSLLYPGSKFGIDAPCGSVRLECVRDGIEDFEMLVLAEKLLGNDFTNEIIKSVTTSVVEFTSEDEKLANARIILGNTIEKAMQEETI